jgi:RimJ/RimL family protein N-acetyltransferase
MRLAVREMERLEIVSIVDYFLDSDAYFLKGMGAEKSKLPNRKDWIKKLNIELEKSNKEKDFYYLIWLLNEQPIGHTSINNINFGKSATMHLHLWKSVSRKSGLGLNFVNQSLPYYFEYFELEKLICEPFSENIAPNRTLIKVGFKFIKAYETVPGWINFSQIVN